MYDYNHPEAILPWSEIVKIMSTDKNAKVTFIYTLQVIEKGEFKYEHHGPPLAILDDIVRTDDNDAAMRLSPSPTPVISSGATIPAKGYRPAITSIAPNRAFFYLLLRIQDGFKLKFFYTGFFAQRTQKHFDF